MSKWQHWLDESSEADDFERAVLRSGVEPDPPDARRAEVWQQLLGSLPLAPLAAGPHPSAPIEPAVATTPGAVGGVKAGTVLIGVVKGFVVGLALYGAASGVSQI